MKRIKTAVIGASGYSGIELLRILVRHPGAELVAVTSRQFAGKTLETVFPRFRACGPEALLKFIEPDMDAVVASGAEIAFLALPHGVASEFAIGLLARGLKVIDLSADFRLRSAAVYKEFYAHEHAAPELLDEAVYALPEVRPEAIRQARLIACPGCYPTSILLPLIPLLKAGLITADPISVSSMSGASGAGRNASVPLLFCEVQNSVRSYSVPSHRHLSEIGQELAIAAGREVPLSFVPHLVPTHSGICSTIFATPATGVTLDQISAALQAAYADQPFIRLLGANQSPDTKNVVGTNFVDIGWALDQRAGRLILMSTEDNIGKGASGQAVQNMNLICGFEPTAGLLNI